MTKPRKKTKPDSGFHPAALDQLPVEHRTMGELDELFRQMKKALMERALAGELTHHLGYAPGEAKPVDQPNHRNGSTPKTVLTDDGAIPAGIPRDRAGTFEPQLLHKNARRLPRFDQNVLSLYARGMSMHDIQAHLKELYQVEEAPTFISAVTDEVLQEVTAWQQQPLESSYVVVFFDCLRVKIRDEGVVNNKAVYVALGVTRAGAKKVLGLWIEQTEGAHFWHRVTTKLQTRGVVGDIPIDLIDGLAGFPEAITAVFPQPQIQTCVVQLMRGSRANVG